MATSSSSFITAATKRLVGKVALITGGASGIGEVTARVFAFHGAKVVIGDIQDELGHSVRSSIGADICTYVHCDVTDEDQVKAAVDTAVETYGKLDIMFCNAGIVNKHYPRIVDNSKSDFERLISINVTGVFLCIKHAARVMIPNKSGAIISSASTASSIGGVASHAYCSSKHAVVGLTKNAAAELGQFGIRVNCISPSGLATPLATRFVDLSVAEMEEAMHATGNLKGVVLKAEDVANAVLFLAGEEARYVSGQNLLLDGGFTHVNHTFGLYKYPEENQQQIFSLSKDTN